MPLTLADTVPRKIVVWLVAMPLHFSPFKIRFHHFGTLCVCFERLSKQEIITEWNFFFFPWNFFFFSLSVDTDFQSHMMTKVIRITCVSVARNSIWVYMTETVIKSGICHDYSGQQISAEVTISVLHGLKCHSGTEEHPSQLHKCFSVLLS